MTSATLSCRPISAKIVGVATTRADMSATFPTKLLIEGRDDSSYCHPAPNFQTGIYQCNIHIDSFNAHRNDPRERFHNIIHEYESLVAISEAIP
jgi:hypothetical protein